MILGQNVEKHSTSSLQTTNSRWDVLKDLGPLKINENQRKPKKIGVFASGTHRPNT